MTLLVMCNFLNIILWSFGKRWFTQLYRPPKTLFHQTVKSNKQTKKPTIFKTITNLSDERLSNSGQQIHVFQNSDFCLRAHILSLATNIANYFPWCEGLTSFISIIYLPNTQVWTANLSKVVLPNKSAISRKWWHVQFIAPGMAKSSSLR